MTYVPFSDLTREKITNIADNEVIFERGVDYFESGAVTKLTLEEETLYARVFGQDTYEVTITYSNGNYTCECTCPYDSSGCKHIVATLLTFLKQKEEVYTKAEITRKSHLALKEKLHQLTHEDLVELLMLSLNRQRDWKNTLMKQIVKKLEKQGQKVDATNIYHEQFVNLWQRASEILTEHNTYGGGEEYEEDEVFELLDEIKGLFLDKKLSSELKQDFIDKLFYFYDWGNSGMVDMLLDTVFDVCETTGDWEYVIKKLSKTSNEYTNELIQKIKREKLKKRIVTP